MNSKERVIAALQHKKPDRTPRFIWLGNGTIKRLTGELNVTPLELDIRLGNDILQTWVSINGEMVRDVPDYTEFTDTWGITWRRQGDYNMVIGHPLKDKGVAYIRDYPLPDPGDARRYAYLDFLIREYGNRYFIGADVSGALFEPAYHLRDMAGLMIDLALENDEATILLDKLVEFTSAAAIECARRGVDWIFLGDDLGSQQGMLMSPTMWLQWFKPRMKQIIEEIHAFRPDIPIAYHSCGSMYPVIGDLVEIGINVLNPIQESARDMSQEQVKREFGDKLTLFCGLDTQKFLVQATPEQVKAKTLEKVQMLSRDGGFIFGSSHHIQPDTPDKNIFAMLEVLDSI